MVEFPLLLHRRQFIQLLCFSGSNFTGSFSPYPSIGIYSFTTTDLSMSFSIIREYTFHLLFIRLFLGFEFFQPPSIDGKALDKPSVIGHNSLVEGFLSSLK